MVVIVDFFTKYVHIYPCPNHKALTVLRCLSDGWIAEHGVPAVIHTDNGPELVGQILSQAYRFAGISRVLSTAYHAQSLGTVERVNGTVVNLLRTVAQRDREHWPDYIPHIKMAINSAVHATTGFSPYFLHTGREMTLPASLFAKVMMLGQSVNEFVIQRETVLQRAWRMAFDAIGATQDHAKELHDRKARVRPVHRHDFCVLTNPTLKEGEARKIAPLFKALYRVRRVDYPNVDIQQVGNPRAQIQTVHVNRIKVIHIKSGLPFIKVNAQYINNITCVICGERYQDETPFEWLLCDECLGHVHLKCLPEGFEMPETRTLCPTCADKEYDPVLTATEPLLEELFSTTAINN